MKTIPSEVGVFHQPSILDRVASGVFDYAIDPRWTAEFLADGRHHLAVALDGDLVVGMASAVHYVHPDKPPELWVNEVGVAPPYWRQGVGRQLLEALFERGRDFGCRVAWVATDPSNTPPVACTQPWAARKHPSLSS